MSDGEDPIARRARITWTGGLEDGEGRVEGDGATMSWDERLAPAGSGAPATSPEELIAAAHAGCYSMSLANVLGQAGTRAERLDVQAHITAAIGETGLGLQAIVLQVRGVVPGVAADEFLRMADEAERQCPISNTMRGNVEIRVEAELLGRDDAGD